MFVYRSELLTTSIKWWNHIANYEDMARLDDLLNKRAADGWELVAHSYMPNFFSFHDAILVTFRKQK